MSEWYDKMKQNTTAIAFIDNCLEEIRYPHSFNRQPRCFANYSKWKASELRCFMIYLVLPVLVKLRLNVLDCLPEVYISHFLCLFIYIYVSYVILMIVMKSKRCQDLYMLTFDIFRLSLMAARSCSLFML